MASGRVEILGVNAPANREENKVTSPECVCADKKEKAKVVYF